MHRNRPTSIAAIRAARSGPGGTAPCDSIDDLPPGSRVAIWSRTSTGDGQDVEAQRFAMRAECEARELEVVGWESAVVSLHADSEEAKWRLFYLIRFARDAGAAVVARDATRFLRHHDSKPLALLLASDDQWTEFVRESKGVRVATLIDPAADNAAIRGEAGRLASKYRKAFVRTKPPRGTDEQKRVARELSAKGWRASEIAPFVGKTKRAVNEWLR